ncbi:MAG TPA: BON domain-containing protein [Bryobacteraceae bacterium]|nr:BON domain-containing protein [Bryobacteraceae bacterium]
MNPIARMKHPVTLFAAALVMAMGLFAGPVAHASARQAADNTRTNKGDASKDATTSDQQKMNPTDSAITRKIRSEIMKDKSLSTYAHNVKIITQDGKVTLKGPVRTSEEKAAVEEKAATVAGSGNVTSELEIAPPKS